MPYIAAVWDLLELGRACARISSAFLYTILRANRCSCKILGHNNEVLLNAQSPPEWMDGCSWSHEFYKGCDVQVSGKFQSTHSSQKKHRSWSYLDSEPVLAIPECAYTYWRNEKRRKIGSIPSLNFQVNAWLANQVYTDDLHHNAPVSKIKPTNWTGQGKRSGFSINANVHMNLSANLLAIAKRSKEGKRCTVKHAFPFLEAKCLQQDGGMTIFSSCKSTR